MPDQRRVAFIVLTVLVWFGGLGLTSRATAPPLAPAASPRADAPPGAALLFGQRLDLNRASAADLAALPGMGPARARRIADHRAAHGPFRSVDDLDAVKGIGPKTIERLRDSVTCEE